MNNRFFELPKEKQDRFINAALQIFAKNGYKKASTDEIVKAAGISKGLLFHYFGSKQGLYEFVYMYSVKYISMEYSRTVPLFSIDFFSLQRKVEEAKRDIIRNYPYMNLFVTLAFREEDRIGKICCMKLIGLDAQEYEYNFYCGEEVITDPKARRICGNEKWGKKISPSLRSDSTEDAFDWKNDRRPQIPYENSIFYQLHYGAGCLIWSDEHGIERCPPAISVCNQQCSCSNPGCIFPSDCQYTGGYQTFGCAYPEHSHAGRYGGKTALWQNLSDGPRCVYRKLLPPLAGCNPCRYAGISVPGQCR